MAQRTEILLDGFGVTESLRWREGALWFSDLAAGSVHRPDGSHPFARRLAVVTVGYC